MRVPPLPRWRSARGSPGFPVRLRARLGGEMGYKGRHRAPVPFTRRIRIPAVLMAMVTSGVALTMGDPVEAPLDQPTVPMPPVTSALPTTPPATTAVAPTTPAPPPTTEAPPPQTTSTPKPKPSKTLAPPASSKGDLVFPTSGPRYGGVKPHARKVRSEEHTSELQSRENLVCRLLLEK